MLKGVLAAAVSMTACAPVAAADYFVTRLAGTFSGKVASGSYDSGEYPGQPEIKQDLAGETLSFFIYYDVSFAGTFGFSWNGGITNSRGMFSGGDLGYLTFDLTDTTFRVSGPLPISEYNINGYVDFVADRSGNKLSNWRGRGGVGGQNYPYFSWWGAIGYVESLSFVGDIDSFEVPEPATWAMMIIGFGLVGASTRRNRPAPALA
jgi:hypothetical protein